MQLPRFTRTAVYSGTDMSIPLHQFDEAKPLTKQTILDSFEGRGFHMDPVYFDQCDLTIGLTSKNQLKIDASLGAVRQFLPHAAVNTKVFVTHSFANAQPMGLQETFLEVIDQLTQGLKTCEQEDNKPTYLIAMENGIVELETVEPTFVDIGCIAVQHLETGALMLVLSAGIEIPTDDIIATWGKPGGFSLNTVAEEIYRMRGGSKTDPHSTLLSQIVNRQDILTQGILFALKVLHS